MALRDKKKFKSLTVKAMKSLGAYRPEFDLIIDIFAELLEQYTILTDRLSESGYTVSSETEAGGEKKTATMATLESLRKDILNYADKLTLTPKAFSKLDSANQKPTGIEGILHELGA